MTLDELMKYFDKYTAQAKLTMSSKGEDYANDADRLVNFKNVAVQNRLDPRRVCLVMISTKVERISNLINNEKIPNNEAIEDSIKDLFIYSFLLAALEAEKQIKEIPF